jgi:hypothetical protein
VLASHSHRFGRKRTEVGNCGVVSVPRTWRSQHVTNARTGPVEGAARGPLTEPGGARFSGGVRLVFARRSAKEWIESAAPTHCIG